MPEEQSGEYEVGFGKPPLRSRFKLGQSGNPKGRPRGSKNLATLLDNELNARVPITENGKRKTVTMRNAISKQTVRKAAAGEERFIKLVFELDQRRSVGEASAQSDNAPLDQDDRKVMKDLVEQLKIEQDNCNG
jgi:Family of unknown function (DUF5681)